MQTSREVLKRSCVAVPLDCELFELGMPAIDDDYPYLSIGATPAQLPAMHGNDSGLYSGWYSPEVRNFHLVGG